MLFLLQIPQALSSILHHGDESFVRSSIALCIGFATDSVEDLIEDVVLKEDEQLCGSAVEHIAEKIVSLPVLVCYGSNSVVLMDTK